MSLVGPRPLLLRYEDYFTNEERRRFEVRPGLTGWAQVHGRNRTEWPERLALDVWYIEHRGLFVDLKILLLTALRIITRGGWWRMPTSCAR